MYCNVLYYIKPQCTALLCPLIPLLCAALPWALLTCPCRPSLDVPSLSFPPSSLPSSLPDPPSSLTCSQVLDQVLASMPWLCVSLGGSAVVLVIESE